MSDIINYTLMSLSISITTDNLTLSFFNILLINEEIVLIHMSHILQKCPLKPNTLSKMIVINVGFGASLVYDTNLRTVLQPPANIPKPEYGVVDCIQKYTH